MNRTAFALLIKFIMTLVFALIAFMLIDRNPWNWAVLTGIAGTIINYLVGDLGILPRLGNISASIGDGILAALTAYVIDLLVAGFSTSVTALVLFGVLVAIGEYFFHQYLLRSEKVEP